MIDINNSQTSDNDYDILLTDPVDYYKTHIGNKPIFRYIQTHPHLDHMRGLSRIFQDRIKITNFWDTEHENKPPDFQSDDDEEHWNAYQQLRRGIGAKVLNYFRNSENKYFNKDDHGGSGDGLWILAPTEDLRDTANKNNDMNEHSYVLWFEYTGIKVIFGGDATETVWKSIYHKYGDNLKPHILKASHHGRDSGYYQPAVAAMNPEYTIVSVGKKPETDASNKYRTYCDNVWSTKWKGNIQLEIYDNGEAKLFSDR